MAEPTIVLRIVRYKCTLCAERVPTTPALRIIVGVRKLYIEVYVDGLSSGLRYMSKYEFTNFMRNLETAYVVYYASDAFTTRVNPTYRMIYHTCDVSFPAEALNARQMPRRSRATIVLGSCADS